MADTSRNEKEKEASGKIFDWHDQLDHICTIITSLQCICVVYGLAVYYINMSIYNPVSIPVSGVITPETFDQLQSRSCPGHAKSDKRAVRSTRIILNVTQPKSQELLHNSPRVIRFVFG